VPYKTFVQNLFLNTGFRKIFFFNEFVTMLTQNL